jgi:DNA-binding XRE family transcriptional regulator
LAFLTAWSADRATTTVCGTVVCARREFVAMDNVRKQFAANLRHHRGLAGLSQEALADLCDLHRTEISLLERCKRSPRLETIVILARGLKLSSPAELLEDIT